MENKSKRISVRVYPKFYQRMKDVMKFKGISQTQLVTNAIDEYLTKIEKNMDKHS